MFYEIVTLKRFNRMGKNVADILRSKLNNNNIYNKNLHSTYSISHISKLVLVYDFTITIINIIIVIQCISRASFQKET